MLQDKYINNLNEIKGFFTKGEKAGDTILDFYRNFFNTSITREINSISSPRYNIATHKITKLLNETETIFPGTTFRLVSKAAESSVCEM